MRTRRQCLPTTLKLMVLAALFPALAHSAGTATLQAEDDTMEVAWLDDGRVRFGDKNDDDYMVVRNDKAYAVSLEDGAPQVIDMSSMMAMFSAMIDEKVKEYIAPDRVEKIERTGASETVAGIKGDVYNITLRDSDGELETLEAVLTDDSKVVELTRVYVATMRSLIGLDSIDELVQQLPSNRRGILRAGDDFHLTSISDTAPNEDLFELPAKPVNLQDMLKELKDLMK